MNNEQEFNLRNLLILSAIILVTMFVISTYVWTQIPDDQAVCVHWGISGECDNYQAKFIGLYRMPLIVAGFALLFPVLIRVGPRSTNIIRSRKAYKITWAATLILFLIVHSISMRNLLGDDVDISLLVMFLIGALFMVVGNYMGKIRSNFFLGIRNPWTLSSDLAWNKTNRLGGKLFVLQGFLFVVGAFIFTNEMRVYFILGSIFTVFAISTAYSYIIWKNDPDISTE